MVFIFAIMDSYDLWITAKDRAAFMTSKSKVEVKYTFNVSIIADIVNFS